MKTLKKGIVLLAMAVLCAGMAVAQNSIAAQADQQFKNKQYTLALESYQKAYDRVSGNRAEKNRLYFQIGECYRLMYNYPKAEHTYRRLIQAGYYTVEPKLYFYMAEMCRFNGKFDDADSYYDKYLELVPGDKLGTSRKKSLIEVTRWAADRSRHVITKLADWNTDYNDWAMRFVGDDTNTLVFTSSRYGADEEEGVRAAAPAVRGNHAVRRTLPPPRSRRIHILPPARGHNAPPPGAGAVVSLCSKTAPPRHFSQRIGFRPHRNLRGSLRGEFLCSFEGVESQKTLYFQGRKWYNTHIKTKG